MRNDSRPTNGYLARTFLLIAIYAARRSSGSPRNILLLLSLLIAPFLYISSFKGILITPAGKMSINNREDLRSTIYGLFKAQACYSRQLKQLLPEKRLLGTVVDVGANLGDFVLSISKNCSKILAIEPGVRNFTTLCLNLKLNSLQNVIPLNIAAHDSNQEVSLDGNNSDLRISTSNYGQYAKGVRLDDAMMELGVKRSDLVKIDVQGHEKAVLMGMTRILNDHLAELVIVEVHTKRGVSVDEIVSIMKSTGYSLVAKEEYLFGQPQLYFR